ncbi:hypothetical protein [Geminocystis sp. GBBB08]|uniref:hypothetical protein n=1 Tax=Geminocystis sp. GBBB08 TaxID=2604140 RepID=UPI0027E37CE2|nr:hypothetical protein [Geminocystis sp. GBBB08]MBL1208163.1 hypothetical protein [Geminocystis sp. GBBB08]
MAKPNYGKGKDYTQLLVSALLFCVSDELDFQEKCTIEPKITKDTCILLVKADIKTLVSLTELYFKSDKLIPTQRAIAEKFSTFNSSEKNEEVKNALRCLYTLNLVINQLGNVNNTTNRHFLLPLKYTPLLDYVEDNLTWLLKSWEEAKSKLKTVESPSNLPFNDSLIKENYQDLLQSVTQLFPKELYDYSCDRLLS